MSTVPSNGKVLGCRLKVGEYKRAEEAAKIAGKTVSMWARDVVLAELNGENRDALRSWSSEWDKMEALEPTEAQALFLELKAGRPLPAGFKTWSRERRIEWLDAHWPL